LDREQEEQETGGDDCRRYNREWSKWHPRGGNCQYVQGNQIIYLTRKVNKLCHTVLFICGQKAFEVAAVGKDCAIQEDKDDPKIDLIINKNEEVILSLTLSMCGGMWKPQYHVTFAPVELEKIDILEAQLRDAQEEIRQLKSASRTLIFMKLRSQTACALNQAVQWNYPEQLLQATHFALSEDCRKVTILQPGCYRVSIRLGQQNSSGGQALKLRVNGEDVAMSYQSCGSGHSNTAYLEEVFQFVEGSNLEVICGANSNSVTTPLSNCFTIVRID
jgi:hypothetical protein